jgi:hypothetical protein
MSAQMRGLVFTLISALALAECTASDLASRGDANPASSEPAPTPRAAPIAAAPKRTTAPTADQSAPTWRHLPEPVSVERFNQDKANCTAMGNNAPGAGSPEMKFYITFTKCMREAGYEPNQTPR